MIPYGDNNEPLTEEELIKQNTEYRKMINDDLKTIDNAINKLILARDKSDKIIGLVIGTEISCFLTIITDTIGFTEMNDNYSSFRILLLTASILIRNINLTKNSDRKFKINILKNLKKEIISENEWLNESNNQKTLK